MNKFEKETEQVLLNNEKNALKLLQESYTKALADVKARLRLLQAREETQSVIYQMNYQKSLEKQINAILEVLQQDSISTIQDFLNHMYEDGYLSIQYSLIQQGIPVITAISQEAVTASVLKSVAAMTFADRIGVNMKDFKQVVKDVISRGIATNSTYSQIAQQLSLETGESLSKSYRIARTEGHRVTSEAKLTSIKKAKQQGADVVKQWDATLDGKTRKHHRKLDGVWVEEDEYFEIGGHKAKAPGKFGRKEEDINCRCILLTRPRWAVEKETTRTKSAKITNEYGKEVEQLINVKNYDDYKKGYYKALGDNPNIEKQIKNINVFVSETKKPKIDDIKDTDSLKYYTLKEINNSSQIKDVDFGKLDIDIAKEQADQIIKLTNEYKTELVEIRYDSKGVTKQAFPGAVGVNVRVGKDDRSIMFVRENVKDTGVLTHEFMHSIITTDQKKRYGGAEDFIKEAESIRRKYNKALKEIDKKEIVDKLISPIEAKELKSKIYLTDYANTNLDEFLAEAFRIAKLEKNHSPYADEVLSLVNKYYKK